MSKTTINDILPLTWYGRLGTKNTAKTDVSIRTSLTNDGEKTYCGITFRHGTSDLITNKESDYIEIAPFKNCLFFRKSDARHGILITSNRNNVVDDTKYAKIQNQYSKKFVPYDGDYELKYDSRFELYYIEKESTEE